MPMELYRAGEALLRSSQPILPFLAPAAYRLPQTSRTTAVPIARHCRGTRDTLRTFSTAQCRHQQQNNSSPSQSSINEDISSLLDNTLDLKKGTPSAPAARTSRFSSRDAQQQNPPSRGIAQELREAQGGKGRSSVDTLLESMTAPLPRPRGPSRYGSSDIASMLNPYGDGPPAAEVSEEKPVELPKNVGRMVTVNESKNMDVGRAFRSMEMACARNSVRKDFGMQRYHERPGMKRKRLKRQRWAKRFKDNFVATVQLVQRMNKQGW